MTAFIAYYRVSTDRQGASALGLEAQRTAVLRHIGTRQLAAEYTEVESGKKHSTRTARSYSRLCRSAAGARPRS